MRFNAIAAASLLALLPACSGEPVEDTDLVQDETPATLDAAQADGPLDIESDVTASGFELLLPVVEGRPAVLYGTIMGGSEPDRLTDILIDSARVEMHNTVAGEGGTMRMEQLDEIPIEPRGTVTFERGGYHGMVFDVPDIMETMDSVPVTLVFDMAGQQSVEARIDGLAGGMAMEPAEDMTGMEQETGAATANTDGDAEQ
ncbi:hypothetical protein B5C34_15310 [Pacificimonas flava]|uniref:Copper chaperone PCu(A)C n=2 Tax=Pacificimonas TaxID=1960290 RepID=A0A219B221_9SPHN|nr:MULTISPECIES: copper chaperone PCu(A)C [Pacificimonas]MBZ6379668.1 copper chaperone PCu(A)C [Pacificimonas aurantium]OWV31868.1 hypothetical protein B5C34_15310 [Pacificimonas flava]